MTSIRSRLTMSYVLALAGTLTVFAIVLWSAAQTNDMRTLQRRADVVADMATTILRQTNMGALIVVTEDVTVGSTQDQSARRLLNALPGYLVVADSAGVLYMNAAVTGLLDDDRRRLISAVFRRTVQQPASVVLMDSTSNVFIVSHFESISREFPSMRIVAGESVDAIEDSQSKLVYPILITVPLLLILSALIAWIMTGSALQPMERLISDLEAIQDGRSLHRRLPVDSDENEVDRLSSNINAMVARLESSFAALRRFTADASHELKTPLTVLRADIERVMQASNLAEEHLPPLEEALAETTRMADLVDSLLTLARADEGRFDLHRERVDLVPIVQEVVETAQILGEEARVAVTLERVEPVELEGDPVRLRQLFLNLATNAVKYTAAEGTVNIALEDRGDHAAFVVQDSGVGIAAADLPFIFDRFWRADRVRSRGERGGVGLGLSIAQWIAHAHGGFISVGSRLGRGSTFTVTLPLQRPAPET